MPQKNPGWTRSRVGRNRVHWVAYDDRGEGEGRRIVDQGYAVSLPEADAAARSALASAGMYQARRISSSFRAPRRSEPDQAARSSRPAPLKTEAPRQYLYTRRDGETDEDGLFIAAHLVVKQTPKRVYVTRRSFGPDQIGSEDEVWGEHEPTLPLDRLKLERDGSVYSSGHRLSDFHRSREAALGEAESTGPAALRRLGLRPPCSIEDIKAAYRRKALEAHPDRGGSPSDFQAVEAAYRRLLREAQSPEPKRIAT